MPCYNEARRLDVKSFREFFAGHDNVRIVFVDDGSVDATAQVLRELCEPWRDRASVLTQARNSGKAEAVRAGVEYAFGAFEPQIAGYWDADLATPLTAVDEFLQIFEAHSDIIMVFGARVKLLGRHVVRRAVRHYLGRVFATTVSVMLRMPIYDTQCGAKLFRVNEATRAVFAEPFLSKWVFDVELLARYLQFFDGDPAKLAQVIYEYPLNEWVDVAGSKVRPSDFLKAFLDVVRIKRKYL